MATDDLLASVPHAVQLIVDVGMSGTADLVEELAAEVRALRERLLRYEAVEITRAALAATADPTPPRTNPLQTQWTRPADPTPPPEGDDG